MNKSNGNSERIIALTLRIPYEIHKKLRFVSADRSISRNKLMNDLLAEGLENCQIEVPKELIK